jgi:deazaflavin-dependent oxidoreductase (nitroreductase family)
MGSVSSMSQPADSPVDWVRRHIDRYVETDGAEGAVFQGATALLLTVTGRKSGRPRRTALYYAEDGDDLVVVASKGGADEPPLWYLNLVADPHVQVQVGARRTAAVARTATAEEKARLWPLVVAVWPAYDDYQARTTRDIPVVVLTPTG